jgi:hypothetical protein
MTTDLPQICRSEGVEEIWSSLGARRQVETTRKRTTLEGALENVKDVY